jgi:hypothetical protein
VLPQRTALFAAGRRRNRDRSEVRPKGLRQEAVPSRCAPRVTRLAPDSQSGYVFQHAS